MQFSINLHLLAAIGNKQRGVVNIAVLFVDRAQENIALCRRGQIHHELVTLPIRKDRPRHGAFRPDQQIGWRIRTQRNFAQAPELVENPARKLWIELLILRHIRLHGSNSDRLCRWRNLSGTNSESESAHNCCQGKGQVKMRADRASTLLNYQTAHSSYPIDVRERDHE